MAFLRNISLDNGLFARQAYCKIESISGDKERIGIVLKYYLDEQAARDRSIPLKQESYFYTPDLSETASNLFKQGYDYVKGLPGFESLIDVLEDEASA